MGGWTRVLGGHLPAWQWPKALPTHVPQSLPTWAGGIQEPTNPEVSEPSHLASHEETWLPVFYQYSLSEGKFMVLTQNNYTLDFQGA